MRNEFLKATNVAMRIVMGSAVLCVIACGGDREVDDQDNALCAVYQEACERQAECGVFVISADTDVEVCMTNLNCGAVVGEAVRAGLTLDDTNAAECQRVLDSASCEELLPWIDGFPQQLFTVTDECAELLIGSVAEGELCTFDAECAPGLRCEGDVCPGTCVVGEIAQCEVGECGADAVCASSGECEPRKQNGEECVAVEFENSCVDGWYCSLGDSFELTCQPTIAVDQPCNNSGFFICEGGQVCEGATCREPTALGQACGSSQECGIDAFCDFNNTSTCIATRTEGQACDGDVGGECGGLLCTNNVCSKRSVEPPVTRETKVFAELGGDCSNANCGAGLFCSPNADASQFSCQPKFALGASCMPPTEAAQDALLFSLAGFTSCESGLCNVFAPEWTCVQTQLPGASCETNGLTLECQSAVCNGGTCLAIFPDECP